MSAPELPEHIADALARHGFALAPGRDERLDEQVVHIGPMDSGGGVAPIGYVVEHRGLWLAFAQTRPMAIFPFDEVGAHRTYAHAVLAVLAGHIE